MKPISRGKYKRWFDVSIVVIAHIVLFPIFIPLWLLIPLAIFLVDGRPVFYTQERVGRYGKIFKAYKFRTMIKDAEKKGPSYTEANDPRVLPLIGRLLRASGLDELPQVINILKGDISLVGPRPLSISDYERCVQSIPNFRERERMMPGLTGLSQLYADRLSWEEWLYYDLEYERRMSFWLDIKILILSVLTTLSGRWDRRGKRAISSSKHVHTVRSVTLTPDFIKISKKYLSF